MPELDTLIQQSKMAYNQVDPTPEFAFKAPKHFLNLIESNNPTDPLLLQVLPKIDEKYSKAEFIKDPVGDFHKNPQPSLIHKYHGRVLLIASPKCDIHCRYCFRRHFPYEQHANKRHWQQALETIKQDKELFEVILSGGDPMSLGENVLLTLSQKIENIDHISTLRVHTRTPIVAPNQAAKESWLQWVKQTRLKVVIVVHCNHANELSPESHQLLKLYQTFGITLLNQSVLLKDINDSVIALEKLSHKLFAQGVLPYYLHCLDRVEGASHFEVDEAQALKIYEQLRQKLPGYLVPKLVREIAGHPYKSLVHD
jgi:EF-P beta-lysylation protein EpmB